MTHGVSQHLVQDAAEDRMTSAAVVGARKTARIHEEALK